MTRLVQFVYFVNVIIDSTAMTLIFDRSLNLETLIFIKFCIKFQNSFLATNLNTVFSHYVFLVNHFNSIFH